VTPVRENFGSECPTPSNTFSVLGQINFAF